MLSQSIKGFRFATVLVAGIGALALAGCDDASSDSASTDKASGSVESRETDDPSAYSTQSRGLWDGRPSFGGVWIAAPDVSSPEQVRVENTTNGKVIKAALYRRERDLPGPHFQVSSDAASELGLQAGTPVELKVVAIRKESLIVPTVSTPEPLLVEEKPESTGESEPLVVAAAATGAAALATTGSTAATAGEVLPLITTTTEVDSAPVANLGATVPTLTSATVEAISSAGAATSRAMVVAIAAAAEAAAAAQPIIVETSEIVTDTIVSDGEPITGETVAAALAAVPDASSGKALNYPFIQVSTVSTDADAAKIVTQLESAGLKAKSGKTGKSYAVVVGPLTSEAEQTAALVKVKELGYSDAFLTK